MKKQELLKKIIENDNFKKHYWPGFQTDPKISDYTSSIVKTKNKFLLSLLQILNKDSETSVILMKKLYKIFNV